MLAELWPLGHCLCDAGGLIEGDVWLNGHPKEQASFARVFGFVEQTDVRPPQCFIHKSFLPRLSLCETDRAIVCYTHISPCSSAHGVLHLVNADAGQL